MGEGIHIVLKERLLVECIYTLISGFFEDCRGYQLSPVLEEVPAASSKSDGTGYSKPRTRLVFGLPGNPVSCVVTARLLVEPAMRRLSGLEPAEPKDCSAGLLRRTTPQDSSAGPLRRTSPHDRSAGPLRRTATEHTIYWIVILAASSASAIINVAVLHAY